MSEPIYTRREIHRTTVDLDVGVYTWLRWQCCRDRVSSREMLDRLLREEHARRRADDPTIPPIIDD